MMKASSLYLLAYNVLQTCLWSHVLFRLLAARESPKSSFTLAASRKWSYDMVAPSVEIAQGVAFLEVLHASAGLVRGSSFMAFLQWFGRGNVLYATLRYVPKVQEGWPVVTLFSAWSAADLIRYPWYAVAQISEPPKLMTWLRYTMFIPLYPIGVASEVVILARSLSFIKQQNLHSILLPNSYNFAFSYWIFTVVGLSVLYPLAFPYLFSSLLKQRKKRLATKSAVS